MLKNIYIYGTGNGSEIKKIYNNIRTQTDGDVFAAHLPEKERWVVDFICKELVLAGVRNVSYTAVNSEHKIDLKFF